MHMVFTCEGWENRDQQDKWPWFFCLCYVLICSCLSAMTGIVYFVHMWALTFRSCHICLRVRKICGGRNLYITLIFHTTLSACDSPGVAAFPHEAQLVWQTYSVFPWNHFDVHTVLYLIMDINYFLPSVAITIYSLTTISHFRCSFHLQHWLNCSHPSSVWSVYHRVWVQINTHTVRVGVGVGVHYMCKSFEDSSL